VAELGYRGLMAGKPLIIPGFLNRAVVALVRFVPAGVLAAAVGRRQSRRQPPIEPEKESGKRP
jgi:short-subunit dehydrogenase